MRVLHVIPSVSVQTGGPAVNLVGSAVALARLGVESTIFTTDMAEAPNAKSRRHIEAADLPEHAEEVDIRIFPVTRGGARLAISPALSRALRREISNYDVVHVHMLFLHSTFAAYRAALDADVPYIVSPCGALEPNLRHRSRRAKALWEVLWQRTMMNRAAAIHYKTPQEAEGTRDFGYISPQVVVPNGIFWDEFQGSVDDHALRRHGLNRDEPIVLFLGRISHVKGLEILIPAFARVPARHRARLVIAGPDDEGLVPGLANLAATCGVGDRVVFTGTLRGAERLAALGAARAWVLPSRTENFGQAVIEALAAGAPVIVSPEVNLAEELSAAGAAWVVERDHEALAEAMSILLCDARARARLETLGREFAARYDWSYVAPQLKSMYQAAASWRVGATEAASAAA